MTLRPLRTQSLRYATIDIARAVDGVAAASLSVPDGQVYWIEARGDSLWVGGALGITAHQTSLQRIAEDERTVRYAVPASSAAFATLVVRKRPTPPNLFLRPDLESYDDIAAFTDGPTQRAFRPRAVELEITQRCNLRCTGCAIIDEVERGLDGFDADAAVAVLEECASAGVWAVAVTGGEPLMKLDVVLAIARRSPLDVVKLQTNAKVFSDAARAETILGRLDDAGLGRRNRFVRPSINVSVGMQNEAGTPVANVVHVIAAVPRVFGDRVNVVLNVLVHDEKDEVALLQELDREHRRLYGRRLSLDRVMRISRLTYNATPRLLAQGLVSLTTRTVRQRIEELDDDYLCLNFERDVPTPLPRILIRADGAMHPCSCFGFVASPGRVGARSLAAMLDDVDADPLFGHVVHGGGLKALYAAVTQARPDIADRALPSTASICKVCKAMREPDAPTFDPS